MRCIVILLIFVFTVVSCKKVAEKKEPFKMYQTSEMSELMEQMYMFSESLKQQILTDRILSELPYDLKKLHKAQMTNRFERDIHFSKFAKVFEKHQKQLYSVPRDSLKVVYNKTISTCVACHQGSCTGPIPRIKKLLIK